MEYRFLGKTGVKVSELCLGAMSFGRESSVDESLRMMDRFADAGGNFIDTANIYSRGVSEEIVGQWLANRPRDAWIIATKVRFPMGDGVNEVGLSRKHILDSVHASLRRLKTDYIDLYQVHAWDSATPLEETLSTLDGLVKAGKVRYIGASNYTAWQLQKAIDISGFRGWEPFICLQPLYNLLDRELEWELVPVCLNEGVGIIPWSPLRGGWLGGRYRRGMQAPPEGSRVDDASKYNWSESWDKYATERTWTVLDRLFDVAAQSGKEPAQVALRWLMQKPGVTAPIIGVRSMRHLESNLGAAGWALTAEQMANLDAASEKEPHYPVNFIGKPRQ
ncbi:MAG: aldo/keto reductase [Anaerolineae bacterium]|nr:aldo/keto reductase [Anaerolineae bacterium]